MKSSTEVLRAMLDERGVEWFESVTRKGITWIYRDGKAIRFHPWQPDTLKVSMFDLTPAQAIEATLGREVGAWQEVGADGGMAPETYIQPTEEGSICPIPRVSVIFDGQKLTLDDEDSARFLEIVKRHFRKLAGLVVTS